MRRLPVIQTPASEDAPALERSGSAWLLIGAAFTVVSFLPLSLVALWLGGRMARAFAASQSAALLWAAAPVVLAYAIAAGGAGVMIGRFGLRAGRAIAAGAGALAGTCLVLFSLWKGQSSWPLALGAACVFIGGGAVFTLLGARIGKKRRPRL